MGIQSEYRFLVAPVVLEVTSSCWYALAATAPAGRSIGRLGASNAAYALTCGTSRSDLHTSFGCSVVCYEIRVLGRSC